MNTVYWSLYWVTLIAVSYIVNILLVKITAVMFSLTFGYWTLALGLPLPVLVFLMYMDFLDRRV